MSPILISVGGTRSRLAGSQSGNRVGHPAGLAGRREVAKRSSFVSATQHTSLRVSPTEQLTIVSSPVPDTAYKEAAAAPITPPNASETISEPSLVKPKPYGVWPEDLIVAGALRVAALVEDVTADAVDPAFGCDQCPAVCGNEI